MCTCMSNKSKTCWSSGPHSDVCKQVGTQGLQITKFRLPGKLPKRDIVKCSTHLLSLPFWWKLIEERKKSNKIILKYKVNLASYFNSVENYPAGPLNQVFIAQIWALWVCESLTVHQIFIINDNNTLWGSLNTGDFYSSIFLCQEKKIRSQWVMDNCW